MAKPSSGDGGNRPGASKAGRFEGVSDVTRKVMRANKGKDTGPEIIVRRVLRGLGIGYRLHVRGLPGRPDIVMAGRRSIIEVRGCFWHRHPGCRFAYTPKTRSDFWQTKFDANIARDRRNEEALIRAGWRVLTVWECETGDATVLRDRVSAFLKA